MYASIDRCSNHFHEDPHDSECGLNEILILQKRHSNGSEITCHDHEILRLRCRSFDVFKIFIKISTHIKILLYIFHLSLGGFIIPAHGRPGLDYIGKTACSKFSADVQILQPSKIIKNSTHIKILPPNENYDPNRS